MKNKAFSLFELLCVLAIVAIFSIGVWGNWHSSYVNEKQDALLHQVQSALAYTRNKAIARQTMFVFCGSSNGVDCDGAWSHGQIVISGTDNKVWRTYPALPSTLVLSFHSNLGHNAQLAFMPNGFTNGQQGHFSLCQSKTGRCRLLLVHYSGELLLGGKASYEHDKV